ncbi:MAG: pyruvate, phosphate dikinase, partial [Nocardioidaceae bacterium]
MTTYVYEFSEGSKDQKDLLGGKGANLAEMTNMGLPVPPGFTITTRACTAYLDSGDLPDGLAEEIDEHLSGLERSIGRSLGDAGDPLLVSVRSGAKFSMPGMMDTVLNIGLNDETVAGLARRAEDERFAYDSYRRLIQMFGVTVLGVDGERFEDAIDAHKSEHGIDSDVDLSADDVRELVEVFRGIVREHTGEDFPQDPHEQVTLAIRAVFDSWNAPRAIVYRRQERIPGDLGTAVNVCSMVFGNLGMDSGTGVAFTRDPASGTQGIYGDYLQNAQGEDVVAGIRNTVPLADLERLNPTAYAELLDIMERLENHFLDLCDIEFTIERGKLWMLQTRVGKRTAAAAFRVAAQLVGEGLIDLDEALRRVTGEQLSNLMFPTFDETADRERIAKGMNASPGAATGVAVFSSQQAVERAEAGDKVILVRRETNPDDLHGMIAATGVLTSRGGKTSHAAVVARGMGRTCVCGVENLTVDYATRSFSTGDGVTVNEGDVISIDGSTGEVFLGEVPVVESAVVQYFNGELDPATSTGDTHTDEVISSVDLIMRHADDRRRMAVRANADTGADATRARRYGAQGIGLCRTEHMFLGDRRPLIEQLVVADTEQEQQRQLDALLERQREDFV